MARRLATLLAAALALSVLPLLTVHTESDAATLRSWYGTVVRVRDGDTLDVDIAGDGTSTPVMIRNAGVQAQAIAHGSGVDECHSREAMARLSQLTLGKKVRTQSYYTLRDRLGRYNRYVDVYNPATGRYDIDVQRALLREGHVLWLAQEPETAREFAYHTYAEQGMATGRNLYDPDFCGVGPAQAAPIRMWINIDADGIDTSNVNGEWVRIKNAGTISLPLAGFYLRKAKRSEITQLPARMLAAGETLTVHVGRGTSSGLHHYWGYADPTFGNLEDPAFPGSAVYLFDGHDDIRAFAMYPCTYRCSDPNNGRLAITNVVYDSPGSDDASYGAEDGERATVTNTSGGSVDLTSYVLMTPGSTLEFPGGYRLDAGQSVVVHMGAGTSRTDGSGTRHLYWNRDHAVLGNSGDWLELRAWNGFRVDCAQWGTGRCPAPR